MHTRLLVGIMFFVIVGCWPGASAQDAANKVVVTITTVKESDWQREMANVTSKTALRERLQARTLAQLTGVAKEGGENVLRAGQERGIVKEWDFAENGDGAVAKNTIQEFIGTEVRVQKLAADDSDAARLRIALTHDLQPPQMLPMAYATAATGAERYKHGVTLPRFERVRWQGEVLPSKDERLLASFLPAGSENTRLVVFVQGGGESRPASVIRQTIYRVPEMAMIGWLLDGATSDAAVVKRLQDAVGGGSVSVVSSLISAATPDVRIKAHAGSESWLPSEMDTNYDLLYQLPASFETVLSGTRLEFQVAAAEVMFNSSFAQRAPLAVKWPTSWLHVYDRENNKPTGKAIHGWMDWYDRFEQEIIAEVAFHDDSPHLVAMLPPPDQTWGAQRQGRWLNVTVMQQLQGGLKPALQPQPASDPFAPADPFVPSGPFVPSVRSSLQPPCRLLLGISLDSGAAQALLAARQPEQDEKLLRELVARVKRGAARVQTCVLSANEKSGVRRTLVSARQHVYPTEMPSIPSAWEMRPVGTRVELDGAGMDLRQDLAPPARTEWKLARDVPQAIMWEPRFRTLSLNSAATGFVSPGTRLCAVASIPAVVSGGDLPEHDTVLLFTHQPANGTTVATKNPTPDFEIEALIFEIPASDAEDWQAVTTDDFTAFTQQRLRQGTAKLQSHALLRLQGSTRGTLQVTEEYMTATEFDPPEAEGPFRMRPTALETLPVGLQFEVEVAEESGHSASLSIHLKHSTAKPIEPGLEETLKIAASGHERYPGAKHEFEEWRGDALLSPPGTVHCLGVSVPPGGGVVSTRIAFVRVRPAK
ncbi:MAG: hypothetical protein ACKVY0_18720 [Prosthecobacter sp.]|uniref:hypothetical protein n=1 Tax=Prosthecobacter sp. TaxID=1965333 RepID=UPI0039038231